jgi:hypothetical protein
MTREARQEDGTLTQVVVWSDPITLDDLVITDENNAYIVFNTDETDWINIPNDTRQPR